jgi:hypothetical protein
MIHKLLAMLVAMLLAAGSVVFAEKPHTYQRLGADDLPLVRTMVRFTTMIVLPEGELISEVTVGDKEYWIVEGQTSHVSVKPAKEGATTNLNIVAKSGALFSFLLEEISGPKGRPTKGKPDLTVRVNPEELSQLKKEKENLTELLSRSERELKEQKERAAEAERKRLLTKEEPKASPKKAEEPPRAEVALTTTLTANRPETTKSATPKRMVLAPPGEEPTFRVYQISNGGILENAGRTVGNALRRVGKFLRIF